MYLNNLVDIVNNFLWGKNILVVLLIGAALYFSFRTKFMQFRLFFKIIKVLSKDKVNEGGISSLETFFLGTACRVGAGNIAGVVAAIAVGGPGSIFWMWLVAILGASTAFIESSLAVMYRKKDANGNYYGGTPFILEKRLKMKWLGIIYAIASIICYFGVIQVMSNSITDSVTAVYSLGKNNDFFNLKYIISALVSIVVAYIIFSKSKKDSIIIALNKIVPVMAVLYMGVVIFIIIFNLEKIPSMIVNIFQQAFGTKEIIGGGIGTVIMQGVRRGLFSNEAGSGNSNYAAASVNIEDPAEQGMVQALGVFFDTLLVCSATAFIVLLAPTEATKGLDGMALFQSAIIHHLGSIGATFTVIVMFFFSLSTILAVVFYGKSALNYISEKYLYTIYQLIVIIMVFTGGIKQNIFVWSLADFGLGIMTVINILSIIFIAKPSLDALKEYEKKLKNQ